MINIKMKPNSDVVYPSPLDRHDSVVLVENWPFENEIALWYLPAKLLRSFVCKNSIGVWKIKQLK